MAISDSSPPSEGQRITRAVVLATSHTDDVTTVSQRASPLD